MMEMAEMMKEMKEKGQKAKMEVRMATCPRG
jgi:hypothetical protein